MSLKSEDFSGNFLRGFSSVLELYPHIDFPDRSASKPHDNGFSLDAHALTNDWEKVEQDLKNSLRKYEHSSE